MKTKTERSSLPNLQNNDQRSAGTASVIPPNQWRRRFGVFSMLASAPVMIGAEVEEAQAADVKGSVSGIPALTARRLEMLKDRCGKSKLLGQRSNYRLGQATGKFDIVSEFAGG